MKEEEGEEELVEIPKRGGEGYLPKRHLHPRPRGEEEEAVSGLGGRPRLGRLEDPDAVEDDLLVLVERLSALVHCDVLLRVDGLEEGLRGGVLGKGEHGEAALLVLGPGVGEPGPLQPDPVPDAVGGGGGG